MKRISLFLAAIALLSLAGCATTTQDPTGPYKGLTAKQIYLKGERAMQRGRYTDARKSFEALDALYPFGTYSETAQLDIIYAYYMTGDELSALAASERFIHLHPRNRNVDYAYYMRGLMNFERDRNWLWRLAGTDPAKRDLSSLRAAFSDFNALIRLFPKSAYASDARQRMLYLRNIFAKHEVQVANFYMKRKAYVAASNRANTVVEHYQGSPYVVDALGIIVRANRVLGLKEPADEALRVLRLNYANSPVYQRLVSR